MTINQHPESGRTLAGHPGIDAPMPKPAPRVPVQVSHALPSIPNPPGAGDVVAHTSTAHAALVSAVKPTPLQQNNPTPVSVSSVSPNASSTPGASAKTIFANPSSNIWTWAVVVSAVLGGLVAFKQLKS